MTTRLLAPVLCACVTVLAACGGSSSPTSPGTTTTTTSTNTTTSLGASHNSGRDCTSCHGFSVAGTAYKPGGSTVYPGAVIRLTTGSGGSGTVVATLTADSTGNFYSNASVNVGAGLYTTITGTSGTVSSMTAALTSGACNRCHTSTNRIIGQ
jgi:hypothetical protein